MGFLINLFPVDFWVREEIAIRDTSLEVLRVVALYVVGRIIINRASKGIARAAIYGVQRLGRQPHPGGEARLRTTIGLVRSVGAYVLTFVCAVLLLRALNFDAVSVVTSASVAGIAVGFGAQKLFKDVICGFFIIFENQYSIGDYVTINGQVSGRVEEMGMRIVKIRDDGGKLFIFANGDITLVCNQSRGAISSIVEMGVPPGSDLEKVRTAIEAAAKISFDNHKDAGYTKQPIFEGVGGGDSTRTLLRIIVQVDDPSQLSAASTLLRDAAHNELQAAGITPF
jgi:small conductance mechanosensitive channel